ncbi:MAG: hypothetical protein ONB46_17970 [candidate division KSB1 bacterium]|nr:hypothetical protein [candidate division KSB1 bacterium]MDZ7367816.1 hypothetical protein [candidate division KSB1 bacterium]MDZ7404856.1 hypothetical protein [candidate division KSB1 bacterium]
MVNGTCIVRPLLGGLAIYAAFTLTLLGQIIAFLLCKDNLWFTVRFPFLSAQRSDFLKVLPQVQTIWGGATLMVILGFIDDRRGGGFSYKIKFIIQIAAACLLPFAGVRTDFMPSTVLNAFITIIWIVGITNAFNCSPTWTGFRPASQWLPPPSFFDHYGAGSGDFHLSRCPQPSVFLFYLLRSNKKCGYIDEKTMPLNRHVFLTTDAAACGH